MRKEEKERKRKRNGKEYDSNGKLRFEGEYLYGKRNGETGKDCSIIKKYTRRNKQF